MLEEYTKDSGLTEDVIRRSSPINDYSFIDSLSLDQLVEGLPAGLISQGVFGVSGTNEGIQTGVDKSNGVGYLQSRNYVTGTTGWRIDSNGNGEFASLTLTGGTVRYQKTSITDSTNAGYFIGSTGFYFGSASDASFIKYVIATGVLSGLLTIDGSSTLGGRLGSVLASAIDASGHFIDANLDTAAKNILASFSFGVSGALQIGTYSAGVSGDIRISPSGIVGRNSAGANTFTIDGTTGAATFAGTLSAPAGTLGAITAGTLTGLTITGGTVQTASSGARIVMNGSTNQLFLYNSSGNAQITIGDVGAGSAIIGINLQDVTKSGIIIQNSVLLGSSDFLLKLTLANSSSAGKGIILDNAGTGTDVTITHSNATGGAMILENSSASNTSATLTVNNGGTGPSINAQKYIILPNQTIENANADQINIGGADISDGNTTFAFRTEGTGVVLTGQADVASATRVKIVINGTTYTLLAE